MERIPKTIMTRHTTPGIDEINIKRWGITEIFITAHPVANEQCSSLMSRLAYHLVKQNAQIVKMDIFGATHFFNECMDAIEKEFGNVNLPISYIEGNNCSGGRIAGIQTHAVAGVTVETISLNGRAIGRLFEDKFARYFIPGNVHADNLSTTSAEQAQQTFENLATGLELAGMDMTDIVRTWFFNFNILNWYQEFNSVRSKFYKEKGIFDGLLPASTGIGGNNPAHAALITSAVAMQSKLDSITVKELPSPLQCPAYEYGSSFSRAVEVVLPDHRRVFISGTASISPDGQTVHIGDVDAQIALTLDVVEAILKSREMNYSNVTRAVAYFKHKKDAPALKKFYKKYGLADGRIIVAHNDICRDDLLFEIEVDAIANVES